MLHLARKKIHNVRYTIAAFSGMWREERSFRIQVWSAVPFLVLAAFLRVSALEWALILFGCFVLVAVEFMNTAFERLGDAVTNEHNPLVGNAKELASAAVFVSGLGLAVIFAVVLTPRIIDILS